VLFLGRYGPMCKKPTTHNECVERRMCSEDSPRSHSHSLVACSVNTNNSPYIEKCGVQSSPPLHRAVNTHRKDVNV